MADVIRINTSAAKQAVDLTDRLEMLIQKAKPQEGFFYSLCDAHDGSIDDRGNR